MSQPNIPYKSGEYQSVSKKGVKLSNSLYKINRIFNSLYGEGSYY